MTSGSAPPSRDAGASAPGGAHLRRSGASQREGRDPREVELGRDAHGVGLCSANGGFLTKHSIVVYSSEPPATPFRFEDVQAQVDATPRREVLVDYGGPARIESYTVDYEGDAPAVGRAALRTPDGKRTWAVTPDREVAAAMTRDEFCGKSARVKGAAFEISA